MAAFAPGDPLLAAARVVVIDACSALDVVRIPVRPEWSSDAKSVEAMLDISSDPSRLLVTMAAAIKVEYLAHRDAEATAVRGELRRRHERLGDDPAFASDMARRCGLAATPLAELSLEWFEAVGRRFERLTDTVFKSLDVRPDDPDDVMPAWQRVAVRRAPATRGTRSMADCVLCETALRVARQRPRGTTGLLTSNKKDFRRAGSLHPELVDSYDSAGLVDLPTWGDALMFARAGT